MDVVFEIATKQKLRRRGGLVVEDEVSEVTVRVNGRIVLRKSWMSSEAAWDWTIAWKELVKALCEANILELTADV